MIYLLSCHTYLLTLWEPRAYLVKYKERGPRNTSLCNILYVRITSTKMQQKCIRRNRFFTVQNFFETKCSKQKIILLAKSYRTRFMITSFYSMRFWGKWYGFSYQRPTLGFWKSQKIGFYSKQKLKINK